MSLGAKHAVNSGLNTGDYMYALKDFSTSPPLKLIIYIEILVHLSEVLQSQISSRQHFSTSV